jgi:hypothetical protein
MIEIEDQAFWLFNTIEGSLWIVIGTGLLAGALRNSKSRGLLLISAVLFFGFGASDFVETRTGAWYRPWWLLAWKASTVLALAAMYVLYRKRNSA